ncbi:hypothetical protein HDZ31DRAFT_43711 [Schizophyllum fasciatum]
MPSTQQPRRAHKSLDIEISKDIVGSYLLDPAIDVTKAKTGKPSKPIRVLNFKAGSSAKINVSAEIMDHSDCNIERVVMDLQSYSGTITFRLSLPPHAFRTPISLHMRSAWGNKVVLVLPASFHGKLYVQPNAKCLAAGTLAKLRNAHGFAALSQRVRRASTALDMVGEGSILCDIRPEGHQDTPGEDAAEVIADNGRVHVKMERGVRDIKDILRRLRLVKPREP